MLMVIDKLWERMRLVRDLADRTVKVKDNAREMLMRTFKEVCYQVKSCEILY